MKKTGKIGVVFGLSFIVGVVLAQLWIHSSWVEPIIKPAKLVVDKNIIEKEVTVGDKKEKSNCCDCENSLVDKMFLENYPLYMPKDVPLHPMAETSIREKRDPMVLHKFYIPKTVDTISSWYLKQMKLNCWDIFLDTSEPKDSMVVFNKLSKNGDRRLIGIRVYPHRNKSELAIILYPDNYPMPTFSCTLSAIDNDK